MNTKLLKVFTLEQLKLIARVISVDLGQVVLSTEITMVTSDCGIINFYLCGGRRTVLSKEQFRAIAAYA